MKKTSKRRLTKQAVKNGAQYAYVCTTVYPDIAGKVIIGGRVFPAYSSQTFYRGDVVLCKKTDFGTAEIPTI